MDQRVSFVTLAVADLERTRAFYVDGLGWRPMTDVPGEVLMFRVGEQLVLSLWAEGGFEAEVGPVRRGPGVVPMTLAHNVATEAEVDAIVATAAALGAETSAGARREWGGYTAYVADPDGFRWEVAVNPAPDFAFLLPGATGPGVVPPADPAPEGLRARAEAGDRDAVDELVELAGERGDLVELRHWAERGSGTAADVLVETAAEQGDHAELRRLAAAGNRTAAEVLAELED